EYRPVTPGVAGSSPVRSATYYETQSQDWVFCFLEVIENQILITAYRLSQYSSSTMFNHPQLLILCLIDLVYRLVAYSHRAIKKPMLLHRLE
ncbi:hypothetical protein, partial [Vibrio cholerae]|uniref:hypothetical protein n=1 Tax=Vibrio cholerae TaxID=666 RepID=UPI001962993F